jgi:hypothetical protein
MMIVMKTVCVTADTAGARKKQKKNCVCGGGAVVAAPH